MCAVRWPRTQDPKVVGSPALALDPTTLPPHFLHALLRTDMIIYVNGLLRILTDYLCARYARECAIRFAFALATLASVPSGLCGDAGAGVARLRAPTARECSLGARWVPVTALHP